MICFKYFTNTHLQDNFILFCIIEPKVICYVNHYLWVRNNKAKAINKNVNEGLFKIIIMRKRIK